MAAVYEAEDIVSGGLVALKRLMHEGDARTSGYVRELFLGEFHALAQLSHPRIVAVHDYLIDGHGPFYTMELLDGEDLRAQAPVPWRELCRLLCDVCSALSLLHSRRFTHGDLTPSNIRCTSTGQAKLIDLGALSPFGPCKRVVGTAPFVPPELLSGQSIDGSRDLYALGATAYRCLTGRHAYRAHSIEALPELWQRTPPAPSALVENVPAALDELVMSLLHPTPAGRPRSAAEVMDRLRAIAGIDVREELLVERAYLTTPTLVGRDKALARIRRRLDKVPKGRGSAMVVHGAAGAGRSRLLEAAALEAKALGLAVIRCDGTDAGAPEWTGIATAAHQLCQRVPATAREAARAHAQALVHAIPNLDQLLGRAGKRTVPVQIPSPQRLRASVSEAVRTWLCEVSRAQPLALLVDDIERLDSASLSVIAWLADEARSHAISVIVAARDQDEPPPTELAWLRRLSTRLRVCDLCREQTGELLTSVFGDVPHVGGLSDHLYATACGNPRTTMEIAQHLLDRGTIQYEAGAFTLPKRLQGLSVPDSFASSLKQRFATISDDGRVLAATMWLCRDRPLSLRECGALLRGGDMAGAAAALQGLMTIDFVTANESRYALRHPEAAFLFAGALSEEERRQAHLALAEVFAKRKDEAIRHVIHLHRGGAIVPAIEVLLAHLEAVRLIFAEDLPRYYDFANGLPDDWLPTFRALSRASRELGRPRYEQTTIQLFTVWFATVTSRMAREEVLAVAAQLRHDTGLDLYAELDPAQAPDKRLQAALSAATARYEATPEVERSLAPLPAIVSLGGFTAHVLANAGRAFDRELLLSTPSLAPLAPLSRALQLIEANRAAALDLLSGKHRAAHAAFSALVDELGQPDIPGLHESNRLAMRAATALGAGSIEAYNCLSDGSRFTGILRESPLYEVAALRLQALSESAQGNLNRADATHRRADLLCLRYNPPQLFEGSYVWTESLLFAASDDLGRMKQALPRLKEMAQRFPAWRACLHFGRGHYERMRSNHAAALQEFEAGLGLAGPGEHAGWLALAEGYVLSLLELGRVDEALSKGQAMAAEQERADVRSYGLGLRYPLTLARVMAGDLSRASADADAWLSEFQALGTVGLAYGNALYLRARVAIGARDAGDFSRFATACARQYRAGDNPVLTAKYEALVRMARAAGLPVSGRVERAAELPQQQERRRYARTLSRRLARCTDAQGRAREALSLLIEKSKHCHGGVLYLRSEDGQVDRIERGTTSLPPELEQRVIARLSEPPPPERESTRSRSHAPTSSSAASSGADSTGAWTSADGDRCMRITLVGDPNTDVGGQLVLHLDPERGMGPPALLIEVVSRALLRPKEGVTAVVAS